MANTATNPLAVAGTYAFLGLAYLLLAGKAWADPCHAIADNGELPGYLAPGTSFSGPVVYVGDGDSLCVGVGPGDSEWVEVRLADFHAPELSSSEGPAAKRALLDLVMHRSVRCVAEHRSYDRIVAHCELNGRSLGDHLRDRGALEGGNAFSGGRSSSNGAVSAIQVRDAWRLRDEVDRWMLPLAGVSAATVLGVLYVGFKRPALPPRRPRRAGKGRGRSRGSPRRLRRL